MPKQSGNRLGALLKALYRWLTPVVRICLFAGMGMGFFIGLYFALGAPADETRDAFIARIELRTVFLVLFGCTFLGGLVGTAFGVSFELAFGARDKRDKKKPWWRSKKSPRRRD
jgi:hypothetical protein